MFQKLLKIILLVISCTLCAQESLKVIYPKPSNQQDIRDQYFFELLKLSLEISKEEFGNYQLTLSDIHLPSSRIPIEVRRNRFVNILTSPTTVDLETSMAAIKIPLVKGIQGVRLLLINPKSQPEFAKVERFQDLQNFTFGQGEGWLDTMVFEKAGLNVTRSSEYSGLFKMLAAKRFDAFPRGLNEIYREYEKQKKLGVNFTIEEHIVFYYHLPVYFFVSKDNKILGQRIAFGLEKAISNGSFDAHFYRYFGKAIANAKLSERKLFYFDNPYIPEVKPSNKDLWLPFILEKTYFSAKNNNKINP